jgi:hypothetical protein
LKAAAALERIMSAQEHKQQMRKRNLRLGLTLASVVIVFFIGFMAKLVFFGR